MSTVKVEKHMQADGTEANNIHFYVGPGTDEVFRWRQVVNNVITDLMTLTKGAAGGGQGGNLAGLKSVSATSMSGTASTANYADLAEKYIAAENCKEGNFVKVTPSGGIECEKSSKGSEDFVFGIVSTAPGYTMNNDLEGGSPIALKGRVPAYIIGNIEKGDIVGLSAVAGVGKKADSHTMPIKVFALESKTNGDTIQKIEVIIV